MDYFLGTLFIIICCLLIVVVLLQKGRGGGLGAAFGGSGSSAFGTKTGDVFTWVTIVLTALFLVLAVGTNLAFRPPAVEVPGPVFEPAAKEITEPTPVTIQKVGGSKEPFKVYYTTDGSNPTDKSILYEKAFEVYPDTKVKAIRYLGSRHSEIREAFYRKPAPASQEASSKPSSASAPAEAMSKPTPKPATAAVGG